jgi:GUN4-like
MSSQNLDIDYNNLRTFLATKDWKAADQETLRIMLQLSSSNEQSWLNESKIGDFCCEDLRIIDRLWLHHSSGHFGFTVQRDIHHKLGEDWSAFGSAVGWLIIESDSEESDWIWAYPYRDEVYFYNRSLWYDNLTFNLDAPAGHLPILGDSLWLEFDLVNEGLVLPYYIDSVRGQCLFDRLENCSLESHVD